MVSKEKALTVFPTRVAKAIGLQMAVIYIPGLQVVFQTTSLSVIALIISVALITVIFGAIELEK